MHASVVTSGCAVDVGERRLIDIYYRLPTGTQEVCEQLDQLLMRIIENYEQLQALYQRLTSSMSSVCVCTDPTCHLTTLDILISYLLSRLP